MVLFLQQVHSFLNTTSQAALPLVPVEFTNFVAHCATRHCSCQSARVRYERLSEITDLSRPTLFAR